MSQSDVQEFLIALSAAGVKHVVVGAYALAAHGYVRSNGAGARDHERAGWSNRGTGMWQYGVLRVRT